MIKRIFFNSYPAIYLVICRKQISCKNKCKTKIIFPIFIFNSCFGAYSKSPVKTGSKCIYKSILGMVPGDGVNVI